MKPLLLKLQILLILLFAAVAHAQTSELPDSPLSPYVNKVMLFEELFLSPQDKEGPGWAILTFDRDNQIFLIATGQQGAPGSRLQLSSDGSPHSFQFALKNFLSEQRAPENGLRKFPVSEEFYSTVKNYLSERHKLNADALDVLQMTTSWSFDASGHLNILSSVKTKDGVTFTGSWNRGHLEPLYKDLVINIKLPDKEEAKRFSVENLPEDKKDLIPISRSTFNILSYPDTTKYIRSESLSTAGSGAFLNDKGLFITNAHVLNDAPECSHQLKCELLIAYTTETGERKYMTSKVSIYAVSEALDIVIAKLETDKLWYIEPQPLALDFKQIETDIVTLGYPRDFPDQLVYSFGHVTGFFQKTLMTSAYGHFGNSGGPAINRASKGLIGVVSYKMDVKEEGFAPVGIIPLSIIQKHFDIKGYVSGNKQKRIAKLGFKLALALPHQVPKILQQLKGENSLLAIDAIEGALLTNKNREPHQLMIDTIHAIQNTRSKEN